MKRYKYIYILLFFICLSIPTIGLLWYEQPEVTENKVLTDRPEFMKEGTVNIRYLQDWQSYYMDHFAYRQELVTANALVNSKVFGQSSEELAIVGKDDWLYLKVSLADYQGTNLMSKRGLYCAARTLKLMQEYVEGQGKQFVFASAPNKNTLYPQYMPDYYRVIDAGHNLDFLTPYLQSNGVNYVDLKALFQQTEEIRYHKGDSHWDNIGAAMVADALLSQLKVEHTDYTGLDYDTVHNFQGDIDKILYPLARHPETEYDFSKYMSYTYADGVGNVEAADIETNCENKKLRLLCFRDSFGNSLLPFLANEFSYANFQKSVPYRLDAMYNKQLDICILELVERNLKQLTQFAPVMPAPLRSLDTELTAYESENTKCEGSAFEDYYKLMGQVDADYVAQESPIYIRLSNESQSYVLEATPVSEKDGQTQERYQQDYGYVLYIKQHALPQGTYDVEVISRNGDTYVCKTKVKLAF